MADTFKDKLGHEWDGYGEADDLYSIISCIKCGMKKRIVIFTLERTDNTSWVLYYEKNLNKIPSTIVPPYSCSEFKLKCLML